MIETFKNILSSVDFWKIFIPASIAIVAWYLNERSKRYWEKWKLKREACIKALDVANALLSSYKYPNVNADDIVKEKVDTIEVRRCINLLACTCDDKKVLDVLKKIITGPVSPDIIVDLRNSVRKELNFGKRKIDDDRENAFIGKLASDPRLKN